MAGFPGLHELFEGRHFDREIIVLRVRWYSRFKLSFRDLVEMMADRVPSLAHTTIMRWGSEVRLGIRQALEPPWKILWSHVASR